MLPCIKICESGHSTGSRSTRVSPVSWQGNAMPTGETPEILESTTPHGRWYIQNHRFYYLLKPLKKSSFKQGVACGSGGEGLCRAA